MTGLAVIKSMGDIHALWILAFLSFSKHTKHSFWGLFFRQPCYAKIDRKRHREMRKPQNLMSKDCRDHCEFSSIFSFTKHMKRRLEKAILIRLTFCHPPLFWNHFAHYRVPYIDKSKRNIFFSFICVLKIASQSNYYYLILFLYTVQG